MLISFILNFVGKSFKLKNMKKQLLFAGLLFGSVFSVNAQQLQTENFNSLLAGNLATDITGTTPGQGGYYLQTTNGAAGTTSTNADASNAQIISSGGSMVLRIVGPDGNNGGRFLWKDGLTTAWGSRTTGNNIIEVEFDINPGGASTSSNTFGISIYDTTFNKVLVGFAVRASTKEMFLISYSTPTGQPVGNYNYSLAAAPGVQLPENQWSRIGISFNKTTGQVRLKGPGIVATGAALIGSAINTDPVEVDIVAFSGGTTAAPNASAATMDIDNIVVRASNADTLLSTDNFSTSKFSVYPNPSNGLVTISSDANSALSSVSLTDLNGRTVKTVELNGDSSSQINISDLSAGVYMMNINSDQGSVTKKIIKN